ncbi:MAG TPA: hypothetical protein VLA46_06140 [Saprospiraceae bacterium]|nr:hypothetical protein [Saprospiraceae bacterium]
MKSSKIRGMRLALAILFALGTFIGFSQTTITWKGGTPGMENDWSCPQNWSSASLPNEFSDVIIPDVSSSTFAPPCIKEGSIEINSLRLQSNASLTIAYNASLTVIRFIEGLDLYKVEGQGELILQAGESLVVARMMTLRL